MDALLARARALSSGARRTLLGITGPPGAGKSTLGEFLERRLDGRARLVGMDGFHLANSVLAERDLAARKGAIETFDGSGYVAAIRRLRAATEATVYVPEFRRELEESIAAAIAIPVAVPLVITEGNYLLAEMRPWRDLRELLDEVWYCESPDDIRVARLVARHVAYGKTPGAARDWVLGSDQRNARLVEGTRERADVIVRLPNGCLG